MVMMVMVVMIVVMMTVMHRRDGCLMMMLAVHVCRLRISAADAESKCGCNAES